MNKLVIVGGGLAGWLAAAALARHLDPEHYEITIVESSHIGNISVGESVVPSVLAFLRELGLDEQELVQKTQAGFKLGIRFQDWSEVGENYFHPFGRIGRELAGLEFFQCWLKARTLGDLTPLMDYSPAAFMAKHGKFAYPFKFPSGSPLVSADHALHLDADLVVRYLREFSDTLGVKRITGHVVRVHQRENGNIESVELNSRQVIQGDFFIDCSGFRGLLIGETLNTSYESWKHLLPCDRAVAVQSEHSGQSTPYMISRARESGWSWHIPLQSRISSGYVFSTEHCNDQEAGQALLDSVAGKLISEPHFIPFRTGVRKKMWKKNCIALGLAAGFLEPLESTAIQLITRSVQRMLELFPNFSQGELAWPSLASEFNARMRADYEEVRDFIILHYRTTKRTDTEFWRRCQADPVPDRLGAKIGLFEARGQLCVADRSVFGETAWQAVLTGMAVTPQSHHPFVDMAGFDKIHRQMKADRVRLEAAVQALPAYRGFPETLSSP
ncbi:tryptophan halogenase family protein [Pseudomonadota bacterium]